MTPSTRSPTTTDQLLRAVATLRALQITAMLAVIGLAVQFVTAGRLFTPAGPTGLHAAGAIATHVLTGLTMIAAFLHRRIARSSLWPAVLAAVVFVLSFVQAYSGARATMTIHVPGALVLTIGTVVLAAWSFARSVASSTTCSATDGPGSLPDSEPEKCHRRDR